MQHTFDPVAVAEARRFVIATLRMMRNMKDCLPDGQWEDGPEEIVEAIKECKPAPDDPYWLELRDELQVNLNYWV